MYVEKILYRDYEIVLKQPIPGQWQGHYYPTKLGLPVMGMAKAPVSSDREGVVAEVKAQIDALLAD